MNTKTIVIASFLALASVLSGCTIKSVPNGSAGTVPVAATAPSSASVPSAEISEVVAGEKTTNYDFHLWGDCHIGDAPLMQVNGTWACGVFQEFKFDSGHDCHVGDIGYMTINGTWQCGAPPGAGQFCTDSNHCLGPEGPRGPQGYQGSSGPAGPRGIQGPSVSPLIKSANVTSVIDPTVGTIVAATASCASGLKILGGGGRVTVLSGNVTGNETIATVGGDSATHEVVLVNMLESYPSAAAVWTVRGIVTSTLESGDKMNVYAYAICTTA